MKMVATGFVLAALLGACATDGADGLTDGVNDGQVDVDSDFYPVRGPGCGEAPCPTSEVAPGAGDAAATDEDGSLLPVLLSATGFQYWGGFTISVKGQSIGIPAGQVTGRITGDGTRVDSLGASFITYTGSICNWHFDHDFYDRNGTLYAWYGQGDQNGCKAYGYYNPNAGGWRAKPGRVCARLYTNFNHHVASVCHSISN